MYWWTADQHFFHHNSKTGIGIIQFANRPYNSIEEMNEDLISRHNEVVKKEDVVIHVGDFSFGNQKQTNEIIKRLNGNQIFLRGNHDRWLPKSYKRILEKSFPKNIHIVACHFAMLTWNRSCHGSYHVFGHTHGIIEGVGKSMDVGVDTNNYYPYSFDEIVEIMKTKPNNIDYCH